MEYFEKLWEIIRKIFSAIIDSTIKFLPLWLIIIGGFSFFLSYLSDDDTVKSIFKSAAIAILNGGIFAALLKSMQFIGIFEDALKKILISKEWISSLSKIQLTELLNSITKTAVSKGFPELSERMSHDLFHNFIPKIGEFYYSSLSREITIISYNKDTDIIELSEHFKLEIKSHSTETEIPYIYKLEYASNLEFTPETEIIHFSINDSCQIDRIIIDPNNKNILCEIPLSGREKYKVSRLIKRKFKLSSDPVIQMTGARFSDGMSVRLNTVAGISADVYPVGFNPTFLKKIETPDPALVLAWEVNTLFFPGDGLTIVLTRP